MNKVYKQYPVVAYPEIDKLIPEAEELATTYMEGNTEEKAVYNRKWDRRFIYYMNKLTIKAGVRQPV